MLYHFLVPLSEGEAAIGAFNVFRYVSFRTAWALITCLAFCYVLYPPFIRWMLNFSNELNVAREESIYQEAIAPMSSIEERVKKIVVEQLGVSDDQVTPDASFVDDLGADSLDTVELVMALEEEFDAEIPDDEAEKITTVKQAVEFIQKNTNT